MKYQTGREEKLDTNTLYTLLTYIDKRIHQEEEHRSEWHSFTDFKEYVRALEDMRKYVAYLYNMSMYPKDSPNYPASS
jgi:hypothetical protein